LTRRLLSIEFGIGKCARDDHLSDVSRFFSEIYSKTLIDQLVAKLANDLLQINVRLTPAEANVDVAWVFSLEKQVAAIGEHVARSEDRFVGVHVSINADQQPIITNFSPIDGR
jgi:hypothetical protein